MRTVQFLNVSETQNIIAFLKSSKLLLIILGVLIFSSCKKEEPTPDPCRNNDNDWFVKIQEPELGEPIITLGSGLEMDVAFKPVDWNECPNLHRAEIKIFREHFIAPNNWGWDKEERVVKTILDEQVNTAEEYVFNEVIIPLNHGRNIVQAKAFGTQNEELDYQRSFFHLQNQLDHAHPVKITIPSPYNGQKIKKNDELVCYFSFSNLEDKSNMAAKVELLNKNNEVIDVLKKIDNLSDFNAGYVYLNTNKKGNYKVRASAYYKPYITTGIPLKNTTISSFKIN